MFKSSLGRPREEWLYRKLTETDAGTAWLRTGLREDALPYPGPRRPGSHVDRPGGAPGAAPESFPGRGAPGTLRHLREATVTATVQRGLSRSSRVKATGSKRHRHHRVRLAGERRLWSASANGREGAAPQNGGQPLPAWGSQPRAGVGNTGNICVTRPLRAGNVPYSPERSVSAWGRGAGRGGQRVRGAGVRALGYGCS